MSPEAVARAVGSRPVALVFALCVFVASAAMAEQKTKSGQSLLDVDWDSAKKELVPVPVYDPSGPEIAKLSTLRIPVLAFAAIPQLVKNVAGKRPEMTEPRAVIVDPSAPYWYQINETYDGITVSVAADRRVNVSVGADFQIGGRKSGANDTLGSTAKPSISILDSRSEEGMEGIIITYTLNKFPDIPYTVTIECAKRAVSQCKDTNVITNDEALLKVISIGAGK